MTVLEQVQGVGHSSCFVTDKTGALSHVGHSSCFVTPRSGERGYVTPLLRNLIFILISIALSTSLLQAQNPPNPPTPTSDRNHFPAESIAAQCLDQPIRSRALEQKLLLQLTAPEVWDQMTPSARDQIRANLLSHTIHQLLAQEALRLAGQTAGPNEIQWEWDRLREQLDREGSKIEDYLQHWQISEAELRRELAWRVIWRRDGQQNLTDEVLRELFERRREEFDGTQRSVSQILLTQPSASQEILTGEAIKIRQQLEAGELTWEQAVEKHSSGVSKASGGRLGLISFHDPMPAEFNRVAFGLQPGQISQPVATSFGVHLIRVDEIRPGKFQLGDVREQVLSAARQERFEKLAASVSVAGNVTFSGEYPYFDHSGKLVVPDN